MRLVPWLFTLVACGATPEPVTLQPAAPITCPDVGTAKAECPEKICPACPKPEEPVAWDWHCVDLHRPNGDVSGYCFTLANVCEDKRKEAIANKWGKPTECTVQHTAHCLQTSKAASMSRQTMCARTAENCEIRRQYLIDNPRTPDEEVSECQPMLNTDRYTSKEAESDLQRTP